MNINKITHGIGYYGAEYRNTMLKDVPGYRTWESMLNRCYDDRFQNKNPTYKGCAVCDEWHSLFKFNQWYEHNYYSIENEKMELDKDILIKGNKIYSPDTCVFVPKRINALFISANKIRGKYPVGVYYDKGSNKFVSNISNNNEVKKIGRFDTPAEAFVRYKDYKKQLISVLAEEYKDKIPYSLYKAMLKWEIEITD